MSRILPVLLMAAACTSQKDDSGAPSAEPGTPTLLRVATFNTSLHRDTEGQLATDLADPGHLQAIQLATILQEVRPDVVLLNEVDHDTAGRALQLLHDNFLAVSQGGREPLDYPHTVNPAVNTGVPSGVDLDGSGSAETTPGSDDYGQDALGYGVFPGQYGLVVLSRVPITTTRTFRNILWRDVPDAWLPDDHYSAAALDVLPLSSKTHADITLDVGGTALHFLVSHPTPPTFDGEEDRNGRRNHDEIVFWEAYVDAGADSWHTDDAGLTGGLDGASFLIAGDLNADPADGDSSGDPIGTLLAHPRIQDPSPESPGGTEQAALQGEVNVRHDGDPAHDTADFSDRSVGNLRVDYVLPSTELTIEGSGVFWPASTDPLLEDAESVSDHRLVWVDVWVPAGER